MLHSVSRALRIKKPSTMSSSVKREFTGSVTDSASHQPFIKLHNGLLMPQFGLGYVFIVIQAHNIRFIPAIINSGFLPTIRYPHHFHTLPRLTMVYIHLLHPSTVLLKSIKCHKTQNMAIEARSPERSHQNRVASRLSSFWYVLKEFPSTFSDFVV